MRKGLIVGVIAVSAVLHFTGCGGAKPPEPITPTQTKIAEPERPPLPVVSDGEADAYRHAALFIATSANFDDAIKTLFTRFGDETKAEFSRLLIQQGLMAQIGPALTTSVEFSSPLTVGLWKDSELGTSDGGVSVRLQDGSWPSISEHFEIAPLTKHTSLLVPLEGAVTGKVGGQVICGIYEDDASYLVCGVSEESLPLLGKVLVERGKVADATLLLEVDFGQKTTGKIIADKFDSGNRQSENLEDVATDWLDAVRELSLDLSLLRHGIAIGFNVVHEPTNNPLVNALSPVENGPPMPPTFRVLPEDTKLAVAIRGLGDETNRELAKWLREEANNEDSTHPEENEALLELIEKVLAENGSTVLLAAGADLEKTHGALEKALKKKKPKLKEGKAAMRGWLAVGMEASLEDGEAMLKQIVTMENKDAALERKKPRKKKRADAPESLVTFRLKKTTKKDRLPAGSLYLRWDGRPNPRHQLAAGAPPYQKTTGHLFMTSDGEHTWAVFSYDRKMALGKAREFAAKEGTVSGTMSDALQPEGVSAAALTGFFSWAGMALFVQDSDTIEDLEEAREELGEALAAKQGDDLVQVVIANEKDEEGLIHLRFRATVPDGVVKSLLSAENIADMVKQTASK